MKLLLTSSGLTNDSIAKALFELVGKTAADTRVVFVPTAMNVEVGDKEWFINDLNNIKKQGVASIDIVDISALPQDVWKPRLEAADVLAFSGGNTVHLMQWIRKSGLHELLPELMKTRVWMGISAGSMVTSPKTSMGSALDQLYFEHTSEGVDTAALSLVDFYICPHLNSAYFTEVNEQNIRTIANGFPATVYALDDNSAIAVHDGQVTVVSEGNYLRFNE